MKHILVIIALLASGSALAQQESYPSRFGTPGYGMPGYGGSTTGYFSGITPGRPDYYANPKPATGPYDRPTFGDPAPRVYSKEPTLGDPRNYRNTNPKTCTSLLCD